MGMPSSKRLLAVALQRDAQASRVASDARRMRSPIDRAALERIASELRSSASRYLARAARKEELEQRGCVFGFVR